MSILAQQNIMNGVEGNDAWAANLGKEHHHPSPVGFAGYNYSPAGLQEQFGIDVNTRVGAASRRIQNDDESSAGYGPGFNRLADHESGNTVSSLLTSLAHMVAGNEPNWGNAAAKLRHTFTSGEQMRSLWNAEVGVNGTPVASGGQFAGYQNDHRYGINNWTSTDQTEVGYMVTFFDSQRDIDKEERRANLTGEDFDASNIRTPGEFENQGQETVRPKIDITATGIRAIPGMMGPRSDNGNGQENRGS